MNFNERIPMAKPVLPGGKAKAGRNRQEKNWLKVNIGEREAKELRALVECYGIEFRGFLASAIRAKARNIEELLNLKPWDAAKISRQGRLAMGRRRWEVWRALGVFFKAGRN
jgi:hypothetical protein